MRALWLAIVAVVALLAAPAIGQDVLQQLVSPGKLAQAHANLESRCGACHASFDKRSQNRLCLACHRDVASDIAGRHGFHGRTSAGTQLCSDCHADHAGRGAAIVKFNPRGFNHGQTDYPLAGAHLRAPCAACHAGRPWRAAPTACVACHRKDDIHKGSLGDGCQRCHSELGWKTTSGFDHATTRFPLTGAHVRAACEACHSGGHFQGAPTACVACHQRQDIHHGHLGPSCSDCHSTAAWSGAHFDHRRTGFALSGAHARIDCAACHAGARFEGTPRTCIACHADKDVHKGSFGTSCGDCHTAQAWPVTRFDHARTGFALSGQHAELDCAACHKGPGTPAKLPTTCIACHADKDVHKGGNGPDCEKCHTADDWKITSFNHDTQTSFPLEGEHIKAACNACHIQPADQVKISSDCNACHVKDDSHQGQEGPQCASCHNARGWKTDVFFDHDQTAFPLIGKHAAVPCAQCHASPRFKDAKTGCADCHRRDDKHNGALGPDCAECHTPADWKIWRFDHDAQTHFPLTGAHAGLACAACHTAPARGGGARIGSDCVDCHLKDDIHRGDSAPTAPGATTQTHSFRQI